MDDVQRQARNYVKGATFSARYSNHPKAHDTLLGVLRHIITDADMSPMGHAIRSEAQRVLQAEELNDMLYAPRPSDLSATEPARYAVNYGLTDLLAKCQSENIDPEPFILRIMWAMTAIGDTDPQSYGPRVYSLVMKIMEEIEDV